MTFAASTATPQRGIQPGLHQANEPSAARPGTPLRGRWIEPGFWLCVTVLTFLGAFVVPFFFPLKEPVYSPAYTAGSNNRMGAMMVALIGCAATLGCLRWRFGVLRHSGAPAGEQIPRRYLYGAIAMVSTLAAVLGFLMVRGDYYYADAGYLLTQLRAGMIFHRHLYSEVEFAYGPFLYFWPAAFIKVFGAFGVSMNASYVLSLVALEAVGTILLFYTVSALPMTRRMKVAAFAFFVIVTLDPQEGLNYTAFRFIMPALGVVLLSSQRSSGRATTFAAVCAAAQFSVSPELGVAFTAAAVVLGLYRAILQDRRWAPIAAAAVAGAAIYLALAGPAYLRTLREFAKGGYSMILEPVPHIYLLLFYAAVLGPVMVADAIREDVTHTGEKESRRRTSGMLLGLYIAGLALLPAALGRCDPLHVSYNGWPLYLLSFVALDRFRRHWKIAGVCIALTFAVYSVAQECALGSKELRGVLLQLPDPYGSADLPRLEQAVRGGRVAFPFYRSLGVVDGLIAAGEYQPMYLCIPAVDAAADTRTLEDMRSAQYVAVPAGMRVVTQNPINNTGIKYRFRFGYVYKQRRAPFYQGLAEMLELQAHWRPMGTFGAYEIFAKNS